MSSNALTFLVNHLPLSDRDREKLICAIQLEAGEQGLSPRVTDRYQAWAGAFLSWCLGSRSRPVESDQIEPFRRALREAGTSEEEVQEAMDALAFLFGAVGISDLLSVELGGAVSSGLNGGDGENREQKRENERPRTLDVGWHDKERVLTAFSCDMSFWDYAASSEAERIKGEGRSRMAEMSGDEYRV